MIPPPVSLSFLRRRHHKVRVVDHGTTELPRDDLPGTPIRTQHHSDLPISLTTLLYAWANV